MPSLVNFLTIPFFKNILGEEKFGVYSYYFSILIIVNSSFAGGMTQSIIRLHADFYEAPSFFSKCIWLTVLLQIFLCVPIFLYFGTHNQTVLFSLLFVFSLFAANFYTTLIAISQANLFSGLSAFSEGLRTIIFLGFSLLMIHFTDYYFLNSVFIALLSSYLIPSILLFKKNGLQVNSLLADFNISEIINNGRIIFQYGGYLIGWFFLSYGISFGNRFVLAHLIGKEGIGHYTASFDILNKSIVLILSPVLLSLFPLIVKANAHGNFKEVSRFINRLTIIELLIMVIALAGFWFIGFPIMSKILNTPETLMYKLIDVQIILGTFVWQFAMLQHKYLELQKATKKMMIFVAFAFAGSISVDALVISAYGVKYAGLGFLSGGIIYLSAIIYNNIKFGFAKYSIN